MAIARKIAYNVVASSVFKVLTTALALVSIGFITRYLGKNGFGDYATVLAFLSFFSAIGDLGINQISTREISRKGANESELIGKIIALRMVLSSIILLISPLVVWFFDYSLAIKESVVIIAGSYLFSSTYQVLNGVYQKHLALDKVVFSEFAGKIVQLAVIILAIKLNLGFTWVISSFLFYMIFVCFLVFVWSRKYIHFKINIDIDYWKNFLKEAYPLGISSVIIFVYFRVDTILLSVIKSSAEVGIYNAAYKVMENIIFFPTMVMGLVFPIMSHSIHSNRERFEDVSNKTIKFFFIMLIPIIIGTLFLSTNIINVIGGSEFLEASGVLQIVILALVGVFFGNFFNSILVAAGYQRKLLVVLAIAATFSVVTDLIFIPKFSYWATATISVLTEILVAFFGWQLTKKYVNYHPRVEKLGYIFLSGLIMAGFFLIVPPVNFILRGMASVIIYMFSLWVFRAVKTEEIISLISKRGVKEYEEVA